jgi:hypothetical protein
MMRANLLMYGYPCPTTRYLRARDYGGHADTRAGLPMGGPSKLATAPGRLGAAPRVAARKRMAAAPGRAISGGNSRTLDAVVEAD